MAGLLDLLSSAGLLGQTYNPMTDVAPPPSAMPVYPMAGQQQGAPAVDMSARSRTPMPAPLPQQFQPQQQPQQAPQTDIRGIPMGGNMTAGFNNIGASIQSGMGIIPSLLNGFQGFSNGTRMDPAGVQQATMMANYKALRAIPGISEPLARLAAINPDFLKQVASQQVTQPKLQETGTDPITGQKSFAIFQPNTGSFRAVNAQGAPAGTTVGGIDPTLPPADVLAQADKRYPGVANRVEQLYRGEGAMPNMRQNPLDRAAMQLIQVVHPDFNMTMWTAKNKMQQQLSSSSGSSLGGRLQALRNAFDHLANASDTAVKKGNYDLGLSPLSTAANEVRSLTTNQRDLSKQLEREAVTYGGERTKFLTGAEGSEAERRAFLDALGPDSAAPSQMAGTIEGEYTQLKSALLNQEQQIREQLGDNYLQRKPIITPEVKQALTRIEQNIAKLRGKAPAGAAPAASGALPSGWSVQVH